MANRLQLQSDLEEVLGSRNVYFQPPESKRLTYDCIIYNRKNIDTKNADNIKYMMADCYDVIFIYRNPDNQKPKDILEKFSYCRLTTHYVKDNLYHDVFTLYY